MHNLLLHCLVVAARVQLGTGHKADVSCPPVPKADLEFLMVSIVCEQYDRSLQDKSSSACHAVYKTHSHLDTKQLEQTGLLSRQLFAISAHDVRVVETRHTLYEDGGETKGTELRVHAVREGVGLI
jgi:hypothetical protein